MENLRCLGESQTHTERQGGNRHISFRISALTQHVYTAHYDGIEHHESASAQYGIGQRSQNGAQSRKQAGENHNGRAAGNGLAVDYMGHGNQAYVLAERGNRHTAKQGGQAADVAIHRNGTRNFLILCRTAKSHIRQC